MSNIENFNCGFCNKSLKASVEETLPIVIPSCWVVCYDHFKTFDQNINCFVCNEHSLNKEECLNLPINKNTLKLYEFNNKLKDFERFINNLESIKNDCKQFDDAFDSVKFAIDIRAEILKKELCEKIDDTREVRLKELENERKEFTEKLEENINLINLSEQKNKLESINKEITDCSILEKMKLVQHHEKYIDLNSKKLKNLIEFAENTKTIKFNSADVDHVDLKVFFGNKKYVKDPVLDSSLLNKKDETKISNFQFVEASRRKKEIHAKSSGRYHDFDSDS